MKNQKNSIRLTNKTAKNLRRQAIVQKKALYACAVVVSIAFTGVGAWYGLQHIVVLPLMLLLAIAADLLLVLFARGRYLSLVGQAICTEAAARQMKGQSVEEARIETARRDLERIKQDLAQGEAADEEDDEDEDEQEDDEDLYAPLPPKRPAPKMQEIPVEQMDTRAHPPVQLYDTRSAASEDDEETRVVEPVQRRRRQARLQVLVSDQADHKAN